MSSTLTAQVQSPKMNPWELRALQYSIRESRPPTSPRQLRATPRWEPPQDPVIYPGIYSGTGFDLMQILFHIMSRPNPQIDLGPVDCSVSLIVCDLDQKDTPAVYVTDAFCSMTGYAKEEIVGRNCRFLQRPQSLQPNMRHTREMNLPAVKQIRHALGSHTEIQTKLVNYKKSGQMFTNTLTLIPVHIPEPNTNYIVGFAVEGN